MTFKEETCENRELSRHSPAEISDVDPPKKLTSKLGKNTTKTPKVGVKKRTEQKPSPETFRESHDVMTQDVKEGFLVSGFTHKNEKEAMCTAAEIHEQSKSTGAVLTSKRKTGRTFKKQTLLKKAELLMQEVDIPAEQCNMSKGDVLSFQLPAVSQASSRGKQRKKTVSVRRSSETKHSPKTVIAPAAILEQVSFHTGNQDCAIQNTEDKTRSLNGAKKSGNKRISTSRSKCKRGRRAVQQLSTEDVFLQEQSETGLSKETNSSSASAVANFTNSQIKIPEKHAADTNKCKAEAVNVPVCAPFFDHGAVTQCASAEDLMHTSDIKTEPACEHVTQTWIKRRNTRRQQNKPAEKEKDTLNSPVKEERDGFDTQCCTFNQKHQLEQETVMRNNSDRKYKGRGQRKQKVVEDSEQALNSDFSIKSEAPCEVAPIHQDFSYMDVKTGLDESHSIPTKTLTNAYAHRKRKLTRKYTTPQREDCLIDCCLKGSQVFVQSRRTRGVKKELSVDGATEKNDNMLLGVLSATNNLINSQTINQHVKIIADKGETLDAEKAGRLISRRINGSISMGKEEETNFDNIKKIKGKKKRLAVKRRPKVAALVEESVNVTGSQIQSVENGSTGTSLPENVSKTLKNKQQQKRKGKRAKKKLTSGFTISNPPASSSNENVQEDVTVNSKRRCRRGKSELPDSEAENNTRVKLEAEDNVSAFLGGRTKKHLSSEKCVATGGGNQRPKGKCNMKTSLSEHTPQMEEEVSDLKNVLMVSFEVDCEAPTGASKWEEKRKRGRKTSKKKTLMGRINLESSEQQKPKCETGVVNREKDDKSKIRGKKGKRRTCTRSGKLSKIAKVEDTLSCNEPVEDAVKERGQSKMSELTSEGTSVSLSSALPEGKSKTIQKRSRRKKNGWTVRKKVKQPRISPRCSNPAHMEMFSFSFNSSSCGLLSGDEGINLMLKDKNVQVRNTEQTLSDQAEEMAANTEAQLTSNLQKHNPRYQKLKSQKPLRCCFCGRSFRHFTAFTVHKRIHTGEKPYRCPTCGKNYTQLSQLKVHSQSHSESSAVCCPCCGGKFKNKGELIMHFHVHMKDTESSTVLEDTTEQGANRKKGKQLPGSDSPAAHSKPFRCPVCLKEFLNRATFKMHRRTHGEKRHTCSVCGKNFFQSSSLNAHEKTHWPVKPYSCSVCCEAFVKLQDLKSHSQMHSGPAPFSCARCEKSFSSFASLRSHQVDKVCFDRQDRAQMDIDGFLISQGAEGQIVTPVYFKCPICKQLHRHWCQYVLHLQTHTRSRSYTCTTCKQQYNQAAETRSHCTVCCRQSGEERACRSSLTEVWKELEAPETQDGQRVASDGDQTSALPQVETGVKEVTYKQSPPPSPNSSSRSVNDNFDIRASLTSPDQASPQPSTFRPLSFIRRYCGRYSCGHCGKSFNQWNKLWLHLRFHRQTGRPFSCTHCDLEFRFLGSYIDHLREHAAQTPYACPLCPVTFTEFKNFGVHVSECHKQHNNKKCNTCGKIFSTLRNLKKHKLLHKGANSHFCLSCNLSFSSGSALRSHLKTHRPRLNVPQPAGVVEPLLFPYHCKKCKAKFSSTDLLQAHQICHFTTGKRTETPPGSVASFIPSRSLEDAEGVVSESSQQKRRLPVSNKKHLFRYPHPDRLYVVPVVSSDSPVVISDREEESQFIAASYIPESSTRRGRSKNQLQDHSDRPTFLSGSRRDLDFSASDSDSSEVTPQERKLVDHTHSCAVCMETFTDISKLHEHYMDHARGIQEQKL